MSCVKCNAWVLTEAEASAQALGEGSKVFMASTETVDMKLPQGTDSNHSPLPSKLSAHSPKTGKSGQDLDINGFKSLLPADLAAALNEALVGKLWEAHKALRSASVRSNMGKITLVQTQVA